MADSSNNDGEVKEEERAPPHQEEPTRSLSPKPPATAAPAKQQRAPRKAPRVKKTPIEAQQPPQAPQVDEDPVRDNPRFFVELHATLADLKRQERRHRLSTLKIV